MDSGFQLVFLSGPRADEVFPLPLGELTAGRSQTNQLVIDDPTVSRKHMKFVVSRDAVVVEDLGSSHGSLINGAKLGRAAPLAKGDTLQVGGQKFRLDFTGASKAAKGEGAADDDGHEGEGTRFMPEDDAEPAQEQHDHTRVFEAEHTRMLDASELRDLKPGRRTAVMSTPKSRMVLGGVILALIAGVAAVAIVRQTSGGAGPAATLTSFKDAQYGYSMSYPAGWKKQQGVDGVVIRFESPDGVRIDVLADKSMENSAQGLTVGFAGYADALAKRHPGFRLLGSDPMTINEVRVIFYAFTSKERQGKAIYVVQGDTRLSVECSAPLAQYFTVAKQFNSILNSFALADAQKYVDYPLPDEPMRRLAVTSPATLTDAARQDYDIGKDLVRTRTVRPENLFRAIERFKAALQKSAALGTHPDFYTDLSKQLTSANGLLAQAIRDQRYKVTAAAMQQDFATAQFEAARLMQMIPDRRDPAYQEAQYLVKAYAPTEE
ncbi:MAG: FHA domain-containing protein [Lentisphaerae bacterium]|nr:FHA domain-containing protein [Lentisphaerota bacterium]